MNLVGCSLYPLNFDAFSWPRTQEKRMTFNAEQTRFTPLTVAICIGTYNQSQYLKGSIESALAQTYPIQEFWVADDASTDDTPAVMEEICRLHPHIRYYRQPKNLALPGNLSWLLAQPSTDLIVRLDSDDRLEPDYIKVLAELMRQHPLAGFAHCDVGELDRENRQPRIRRLMRTKTYESPEEALKSNASGYRTAANCILYRAQALRDVNYYIPNLDWRTCEDWDMCLRIAAAGWGNVYAPKVLSNYRVWDDAQGVRAKRKMSEVMTNIAIYKHTLIPEYQKRGWSIAPLERNMRSKAIAFADAIDSPLFTEQERREYKALLYDLGKSKTLTIAIILADHGFNPVVRWWSRTRLRFKDTVKVMLRAVRPARPATS
jgi:glycosyltransferase involved in cell wall biosynthesis